MSAKVIAVGNLKGGVGKSTLAVNLAAALAGKRRVIVVDADAQGTAGDWIGRGNVPVTVERLPLDDDRGVAAWLARLATIRAGLDVVVVDLPPHLGGPTRAALAVADLVVVPVTPSGADLMATGRALDLVREARAARGTDRPRCLLVPSRVDRRTGPGREIEAALGRFGEPIAPAVGQRSAFVDSFTTGSWVGAFAPGSKAAAEIAALAALVARRW